MITLSPCAPPSSRRLRTRAQAGFTLIELMITVAIIGILAAIALPAYGRYITKSRARSASADLVALSLVIENRFQKTLSYPSTSTTTTAGTISAFTGWSPSQAAYFTYSYTYTAASGSTAESYQVKAVGSGTLSGCTLMLTSPNTRTTNDNATCGFSGSW